MSQKLYHPWEQTLFCSGLAKDFCEKNHELWGVINKQKINFRSDEGQEHKIELVESLSQTKDQVLAFL